MDTFHKLFGSLLVFVSHCFDRIVIQGYLPLLTREEHIVHFFRDVHGIYPITKEALRQRTQEYQQWVEAFARNHRIPIEWADDTALKATGLKRDDYGRRDGTRFERRKRFGVYFILKSLEQGPTFHSRFPTYPTDDPNYRILRRTHTRYTHYYFYIRDEVLGPFVLGVGSFLPFQTTYYLNGHHVIAGELQRAGTRFRKDDNAFLAVSDVAALHAIADALRPEVIRKRLEYWTLVVGPKFSTKDRAAVYLRRAYSLNQVEYCRNVIFRRPCSIHQTFERSCELGVFRLTADVIVQIFGVRKHKRFRGKLPTMLEKIDHGHHVLRVYCKSLVGRLYEKFGDVSPHRDLCQSFEGSRVNQGPRPTACPPPPARRGDRPRGHGPRRLPQRPCRLSRLPTPCTTDHHGPNPYPGDQDSRRPHGAAHGGVSAPRLAPGGLAYQRPPPSRSRGVRTQHPRRTPSPNSATTSGR